jgi:hypothetical protein
MQDSKKIIKNLEWFLSQPVDDQLTLFGHYLEIAKLIANQLFEDEVREKAGKRY